MRVPVDGRSSGFVFRVMTRRSGRSRGHWGRHRWSGRLRRRGWWQLQKCNNSMQKEDRQSQSNTNHHKCNKSTTRTVSKRLAKSNKGQDMLFCLSRPISHLTTAKTEPGKGWLMVETVLYVTRAQAYYVGFYTGLLQATRQACCPEKLGNFSRHCATSHGDLCEGVICRVCVGGIV